MQIKFWITLNEPWVQSLHGYGDGSKAPGILGVGDKAYIAAHNQIRAHAKAYRVYENEFAATQNGQVGITLNTEWAEPEDPNDPTHVEAADTNMQFFLGWFMHPIYVDGGYPEVMREKVRNNKQQVAFIRHSNCPELNSR